MKKAFLLFTFIMMITGFHTECKAQKPIEMCLWENGMPNNNGDISDTAKVWVYLPKKGEATGRAIVVCPGGGYQHLAMQHEGHQWAPFFANQGIATIVLKYRMPKGNPAVPVADAEEAIRLVRRNAAEWGINSNDIGIMGSSAGGHLASTVATHVTGEGKPNFQILFYPVITMRQGVTHRGSHNNLIGEKASPEAELLYSNEKQVSASTPRAFIALSNDDRSVPAANGVEYYLSLNANKVPASLHVYPTGGHGWGIRESFRYHLEVMSELRTWLKSF